MSRVYIARDRRLQRRIAVKVLSPELASELSADRFRREIMFSAALQHPHIVGVLGAVTARVVDASDGYMRWADVYDGDKSDVFAIQDHIAEMVRTALADTTRP